MKKLKLDFLLAVCGGLVVIANLVSGCATTRTSSSDATVVADQRPWWQTWGEGLLVAIGLGAQHAAAENTEQQSR